MLSYILSFIIATIWEGSLKSVFVATLSLLLAIVLFIVIALPQFKSAIQEPLRVDLAYIEANTFEWTSLQSYTVDGSEMIDTGWYLEVVSTKLGNVVNTYYYGLLKLEGRYLMVRTFDPIITNKLSYFGAIYPLSDDDFEVVEDIETYSPEIVDALLPVGLSERRSRDDQFLIGLSMIFILPLLIVAGLGFYRFVTVDQSV